MKKPALDLAIVGAGLAGLAAARRAAQLGLSAEIFEASDDVGGRVRSDRVNGFICDRGFQLVNPAYPALSRFFPEEFRDGDSFHRLARGVDVVIGDRTHRLGDPRESFGYLSGDLSFASGRLSEKLRFARYLRDISQGRDQCHGKERASDPSFEAEMLDSDIGTFYARVIGPFATGVFLNLPSRISARVARELIHYFLIGEPGLPKGGVGELSKILAQGVNVHLRSPVDEVGERYIRVGRKKVIARAVIIATDPVTVESLISIDPSFRKRGFTFPTVMSASHTWYHSTEDQEFPGLLRIDGGGGGPVTNTIAISRLAPEYAPEGRTLISTTVMSAYGQEVSEARVRRHLSLLWKRDTSAWKLVAKYSIPKSLPLMSPGTQRQVSLALPTKRGSMLRYIAGDFLTLPAQQGAMESGIDAAEEIAARL